jgi:hypothetical protein
VVVSKQVVHPDLDPKIQTWSRAKQLSHSATGEMEAWMSRMKEMRVYSSSEAIFATPNHLRNSSDLVFRNGFMMMSRRLDSGGNCFVSHVFTDPVICSVDMFHHRPFLRICAGLSSEAALSM